MGIEAWYLLRAQQGGGVPSSMLAHPLSDSFWGNWSRGPFIAFLVILVVFGAAYLVLGLLSNRQNRDQGEGGTDDAIERLARVERSVQRLNDRVGNLEEKVRVEVVSMGRAVSTIIENSGDTVQGGRGEAVGAASKNQQFKNEQSLSQRNAPGSQSRYESAKGGAPIATSSEIVPLEKKLGSSRRGLLSKIKSVFLGYPALDAETLEELEVLLVTSDLGLKTASAIVRDLKQAVREGKSVSKEFIMSHIHGQLRKLLEPNGQAAEDFRPVASATNQPKIVFVVGVNGVGKTTTVAKLAHRWTSQGARVVLAAADTFRAAADEQLREWGERVGVKVVAGSPDDKPSTVVHSALELGKRESADVILVDTAGRLHNRGSLMQELEGMVRVVKKLQPNSPEEVWLIIDGTTGQNALVQAREFQSSVPITGVIVTKLDGTAKGGVVVAVSEELGIPVRFIGVGETWNDLRPFDPDEFVSALLGDGSLRGLE
jgi:fused signal recognition particle receptor